MTSASRESLDGSSETADELDQHQLSSANLRANVSALFGERPQIASGRVDILGPLQDAGDSIAAGFDGTLEGHLRWPPCFLQQVR